MKKLFTIFALLFCAFAIQACTELTSGEDDDVNFYLDISRNSIVLTSADATTETITIDCSLSWEASCDADWLTITPEIGESGKTEISIEIKANATGSDRSSEIVVSANDQTGSITVEQPCYEEGESYLSISPQSITLSEATADVKTITIVASESWNAEVTEGATWIMIDPSTGDAGESTSTITIAENTSTKPQTAKILFSIEDETFDKEITITQPATTIVDEISLSSKSKNFNSAAEQTFSLTVTSNTEWSASNIPDWVELSKEEGDGTETITVKCLENTEETAREEAQIIFTAGTATETLTINQAAAETIVDEISLSSYSKNFVSAAEQTFNLTVTSNTEWSASNIPDWVELSKEEGDGTETITVKCLENTTYIARTEAEILFTAGTATKTLSINQAAAIKPTLTFDKDSNSVDAAAGSFTITLTSNTDWVLKSKPSWVTAVTPSEGSGNKTITVTYSEQTDTATRTGDIVFTYNNQDVKYTLTQEGAEQNIISISPSGSVDVEAAESQFAVTVTCDGTFSVSPNKDWVTSEISGNTATLKCAENLDTTTKVAVVTFTAQSGESTSLIINQAAAATYCSISPDSDINVYQSAISQTLTITSNASWSISSSDSWFTFDGATSGTGDATVTLNAAANNTSSTKSAKITLQATGCDPVVINVSQSGPQLPDFGTEEL